MTAQDLIEAFCAFYKVERPNLQERINHRFDGANAEFEAWFRDRALDQGNLSAFYEQSQWASYQALSMAVTELQGWAKWLRQQFDAAGARAILDVGCGFAACTGPLAAEGYGVVLADVPGRHLGLVADLYPLALVVPIGDLDGEFEADAVVCLEVFEHLLDPEPMLDLIAAHLNPGGLLAASWTAGASPSNLLHLDSEKLRGEAFERLIGERGLSVIANRGDGLRVWRRMA